MLGGLRLGTRGPRRPAPQTTTPTDLPVVPGGRRRCPALPAQGAPAVGSTGGVSPTARAVRTVEPPQPGHPGPLAVARSRRGIAALRPACSPSRLRYPL